MTIKGYTKEYCYETLIRDFDWANDDLDTYSIERGADGIWTLTATETS